MTYVPSYVRRYPFHRDDDRRGGRDHARHRQRVRAAHADVRGEGGEPLFASDGTPTETSRAAIAFCEAYAIEHERTKAFVAALSEHNLLVERSATIRPVQARNGSEGSNAPADISVGGFRLVDEAAFRALDRSVVADFYARGWLDSSCSTSRRSSPGRTSPPSPDPWNPPSGRPPDIGAPLRPRVLARLASLRLASLTESLEV